MQMSTCIRILLPEDVMKQIEFKIKNGEYGPLTSYLGAGISKVKLGNGDEFWSIDSKKYVKAAIKVTQGLLAKDGCKLKQVNQNMRVH